MYLSLDWEQGCLRQHRLSCHVEHLSYTFTRNLVYYAESFVPLSPLPPTAVEVSVTQQTTWAEKLDEPRDIEIRPVPEGRKNLRAGQLMLFPNGRAIDTVLRAIPPGRTMTQKELRTELANRHGADIVCPVTTGICLRTVAEAANEAFTAGHPIEAVTPVWRVLDAKSPALKKLSFDPAFLLDRRAREAR